MQGIQEVYLLVLNKKYKIFQLIISLIFLKKKKESKVPEDLLVMEGLMQILIYQELLEILNIKIILKSQEINKLLLLILN